MRKATIIEPDTPCVVVDLPVAESNIRSMIAGLKGHGIAHRPHFKAHKSIFLARRQMELGAAGMTCATVGEAEALVQGGIDDILIAYPIIGEAKIGRMIGLSAFADIVSCVNSIEGACALSEAYEAAGLRARVLVEIEGGMGRSPITLDGLAVFAQRIKDLPGLRIIGAMTYRGGIYDVVDESERRDVSRREAAELLAARGILNDLGIDVQVLSGGSSFSGKYPECVEGLTEVRSGNYIFNDVAQLSLGMVRESDCALRVRSTVVTVISDRQVVIDAGSKTLSSDTIRHATGYGRVVGCPDAVITKLSEEHGYIALPEGVSSRVGDILEIIPNHACVVPNLADELFMRSGGTGFYCHVDARGKNR